MAYTDAQGTNNSIRSNKIYSDLNLNFTKNPATKDVARLTDVEAVKRAVRNLILTNQFERPFHPEIGSSVRDILFEPMTPIVAQIIARKVEDVIENYEPRARLVGVTATPNLDRNEYNITIHFYVVNAPTELVEFDVLLERLR